MEVDSIDVTNFVFLDKLSKVISCCLYIEESESRFCVTKKEFV